MSTSLLLCIIWIIIKSSSSFSSSSHLHRQVIFIKSGSSLDHHRNWIITGSSSKLDHHWIIINITASAISIKWYCLSILLVTGIYTETTIFNDGCRPSLHVGLHQHSQPFFMLDVLPCSCKYFSYRSSPFSYWMQHLASHKDFH